MKVHFVGGGPGDPELLTVKAKRLIETCGVCIYAGSLVSDDVIALIPQHAKRYDSAKMTLAEVVDAIAEAKEAGEDVVRLHSGDPSIYGAIREQMIEMDKLGIEYDVTPGISSFLASAAAVRCELTAPEVSQTIILTRRAGRTPVPDEQALSKLAESKATLCVFLSIGQIADVVTSLAPSYGEDCPVAVVYRASWPDQQVFRGTLADIAAKVTAAGIKKTAMIIVGHALGGGEGAVSRLYDGAFSHEYRKADEQ